MTLKSNHLRRLPSLSTIAHPKRLLLAVSEELLANLDVWRAAHPRAKWVGRPRARPGALIGILNGGEAPHPRRGPLHRRQHRQAAGVAGALIRLWLAPHYARQSV